MRVAVLPLESPRGPNNSPSKFGLLKILSLFYTVNRAYEYEFQEYHITKVWTYLHEHFGFNIPKWKERFNDYKQKQTRRQEDEAGMFNRFGNQHINPVLNEILGRNVLHPTFNALVQFIVTGKKQN